MEITSSYKGIKTKASYVLPLTVLIFLFTIEISFTRSITLNVFLVGSIMVYLVWQRKLAATLMALFLPLIPALATFWSVYVNGSGLTDAWILFSRTFAFAGLGILFLVGIDLEELLLKCEEMGMPKNFVYGILVVVNAVPEILREVSEIEEASLLRGKKLHFWSSLVYVKVIFVAYSFKDRYTEAMYSHGYDEDGTRTHYERLVTPRWSWLAMCLYFVVSHIVWFIQS